jgi:dihydropteroate synthase
MATALDAGASLVNDVAAMTFDPVAQVQQGAKAPICLIRTSGDPETMQNNPPDNVLLDVYDFLAARIAVAGRNLTGLIVVDQASGLGDTRP